MLQKFLAWLKKLFGEAESAVKSDVNAKFTGFIKDADDARDHIFGEDGKVTIPAPVPAGATPTSSLAAPITLSPSVDLTSKLGPVDYQGTLNTCVAEAGTALFQAVTSSTKRSRLFAYYNARAVVNQQNSDVGSTSRSCCKAISTLGIADENLWPYTTSQVNVKPSAAAYSDGLLVEKKIASYATFTSFAAIKAALNSGYPVMFSFAVPASFYNRTTASPVQPLRAPGESILGYHCVLAVGYDDSKQLVKVRNSWGTGWGAAGYFYLPYTWFATVGASSADLIIDPWVMVPA